MTGHDAGTGGHVGPKYAVGNLALGKGGVSLALPALDGLTAV
jgi:hypothetical protein